MILAVLGLDGRSLASHIAMLVADAIGATSPAPVTLVRAIDRSDTNPAATDRIVGAVRIVEVPTQRETWSIDIDRQIAKWFATGARLVLDLPGGMLGDAALARRPDTLRVAPIATTGGGIDLLRRAARLEAPTQDGRRPVRPPIAIACGWQARDTVAGSDLARRLAPAMLAACTVPTLPNAVWERIADGAPGHGASAIGANLLRHLLHAFDGTEADAPDGGDTVAARLWRLAADMDNYAAGIVPTEADLAACPKLDGWREVYVPEPALVGRAIGHPRLRAGRLALTSGVVHTDRRTYARTMSTLYRLGEPAGDRRVG